MSDPSHGLTVSSIHHFLVSQDQPSLLAWLELGDDASPDQVRQALDDRRRWAQAQQSNPRHRDQAMWTIRHHRSLLAVLVDDPERHDDLRAQLDLRRRETLYRQVAEACGVGEDPDADPLLAQLKQRLGLDGDQAGLRSTDHNTAPGLQEVIDKVQAAGTLSATVVDGIVRSGRAHGMDDQHIALLLIDEHRRAERSTD